MELNLNEKIAAGMRGSVLAATMLGFSTVCGAQTATSGTTFTICALNVDGLPNKINGIDINPDGKGAEGAAAIGSYLANKGYDVVALSEDFNYHENLVSTLGDGYTVGTWRDGIDASAIVKAADTDGLCFITKQPVAFSGESWTKWSQSYGKLTNGSDELINKGYRYYTVALTNGTLVDFYTMHMDADTEQKDMEARASQWKQLREAVLANNNRRPIIIMGDTNSRYTRDEIRSLFINPITEANQYSVSDAWIELCRKGEYPELGSDALVIPDDQTTNSDAYNNYEIVDKVLYLNPTFEGAAHITPTKITFDANGYTGEDGKLMGDHVPVVVEFSAEAATSTDIPTYTATDASAWWRGEDISAGKEAYMYNVGLGYFITSDKKPTVKSIENAQKWLATKKDDGLTFASGSSRIRMQIDWGKWNACIKEGSGATTFSVEKNNDSDVNAYKLTYTEGIIKKDKRYFNIDRDKMAYTAAEHQGPANDWLFISDTQKDAYSDYVGLFTQANAYVGNENLSSELADELAEVLNSTSNSNYKNYDADSTKLKDIIAKLKESITTSVARPSAGSANAKVEAIYTIDGKRVASMQRGINIVKMSDGTVKKMMK